MFSEQALSQQHKRLHSLAEHVPHGYRRKALFEVLIRYNVPLLRATWFIKVTYLNQVENYVKSYIWVALQQFYFSTEICMYPFI